MLHYTIETGRIYNGEQVIHVLVRNNSHDDDRFLKHDIVFHDGSRSITGTIDFDDNEDRDDFFEFFPSREQQKDFILGVYDDGRHKIASPAALEQLRYYAARY